MVWLRLEQHYNGAHTTHIRLHVMQLYMYINWRTFTAEPAILFAEKLIRENEYGVRVRYVYIEMKRENK